MKRISVKHDNKDRIICVSAPGKQQIYFQPAGTKERIWLFDTPHYSTSLIAFFHKYGRNIGNVGFSMTVKELYEIGNDHNERINKVLDCIPAQVEYVLRERADA